MAGDGSIMAPDATSVAGPTARGRRATRNVWWLGWGQIVVAGFSIVWLFTIPRLLGPSDYGLIVLFGSLIDMHTMASGLGMGNALAYYLPQYRVAGKPARAAGLTLSYGLLAGSATLVGTALVVLVAAILTGKQVPVIVLGYLALAALLQGSGGVANAILYGENRITHFAVRAPLQQLLSLLLLYAGFRLYRLPGAVGGMVWALALTFIWLLAVLRPWRYWHSRPVRWGDLRGPLSFGLLSMFGSLAAMTLSRGGNIVLAGVGRSSAEVASFAIGVGFVLQGSALLNSMATALTPGLADLIARGEQSRAADWVTRAGRYQTIASIFGIAFMVFVGREFLHAAIGGKYSAVYACTIIALSALIPLTQTALANQAAIAWGHPRLNLETWVVLGVVYVTATGLLGGFYGVLGGACGLLIASWIVGIYVSERLRRLGGPALCNRHIVNLVLFALPGLALAFWRGRAAMDLTLLGAFCLYYVVALALSKAVSAAEIMDVIHSLRRDRPGGKD